MHKGGPGRNKAPVANPNFIVTEFSVKANSQPVKLTSVTASFSQRNWAVAGAIDGNPKTGWAINPEFGKPAWAIFRLAEPLKLKPGSQLVFSIEQNYGGGRTIGRPRLSAIDGDPSAINLPNDIAAILLQAHTERRRGIGEHYLSEFPPSRRRS